MSVEIHPFREEFLPALLDLQHRLTPVRRQMSLAMLRDSLMDSARGAGKNVSIVLEAGKPAGYLAWVEGEDGEFFGAPFVADSERAAQALVQVLLERSREKIWVRVSAFPEEEDKIYSLRENGFSPVFEFVDFEVIPSQHRESILPRGVVDQSILTMPPFELARLNNEAFAGVDNSLPMDEEGAQEILFSSLLDPSLSRIWRDASGRALAFSLGNKDGYLDSIGVRPSEQRKGIGTQLYSFLLSQAAANGHSRVFATVSSRNEGSLRMHRHLGIPEVERRTVWEKPFRG